MQPDAVIFNTIVKKKNIRLYIGIIFIFILIVILNKSYIFFSILTKENLYDLPFIRVELPDNYQPINKMLSTGNNTFIILGTKKMGENDPYNTKIFLISSEGKILDEFEGSKRIAYLDDIIDIGIVASDYSSPYVGGNLHFTLTIKNNKIIQGKDLDGNIRLNDLPHVISAPTSPNVLTDYHCYLALDLENGGCTYGLTTVKIDDKKGYTTKNKILSRIKVNENHTAILVRSNIISKKYDLSLLILGPR